MDNLISFQIEPKQWPADFGSFDPESFRKCGVGYAAIYHLGSQHLTLFGSTDLAALGRALRSADYVIGYNCVDFDRHLLAGSGIRVAGIRWLDLMILIRKETGCEHSLTALVHEINQSSKTDGSLEQHRQWVKEQNQIHLAERCANGALNIANMFEYLRNGGELATSRSPLSDKMQFREAFPKPFRK